MFPNLLTRRLQIREIAMDDCDHIWDWDISSMSDRSCHCVKCGVPGEVQGPIIDYNNPIDRATVYFPAT